MTPEEWQQFEIDALEIMQEADVAALREAVASRPDDLKIRVQLATILSYTPEFGVFSAAPHLEMIIERLPFLTLANAWELGRLDGAPYERFSKAWRKAVRRSRADAAALYHAACFFLFRAPTTTARLLSRALSLNEPIPTLYSTAGRFSVSFPALARDALGSPSSLARRAHALSESGVGGLGGEVAYTLWHDGQFEEATELANRTLRASTFNSPEGIHLAHTVVGLGTLEADPDFSASCLRESALRGYGAFGPSLDLAIGLLGRGFRRPTQLFLEALTKADPPRRSLYVEALCQMAHGGTPSLQGTPHASTAPRQSSRT